MVKINQRRYLGNKQRLLDFIYKIINSNIKEFNSFCDIFAGTGAVANYFNHSDNKIIINDLLYHNYISHYAFLSNDSFDIIKIDIILNDLNNINIIEESNYFAEHFGDRYFSRQIALKIGAIREKIESLFINQYINFKEKSILITSLIYAIDKIANTVGHYDAYIKKEIKAEKLFLDMLSFSQKNNINNEIFNMNANDLIKNIDCDILYLDPPYNSRQYSDAYHLLENLALWQKPKLFGDAKKFDRANIKSNYNKTSATKVFEDLIKNAKARYILLSYNNMANQGNDRSNARISDENIFRILNSRGKVNIFETDFKEFNTGKIKRENNKERIFFVEVEQ